MWNKNSIICFFEYNFFFLNFNEDVFFPVINDGNSKGGVGYQRYCTTFNLSRPNWKADGDFFVSQFVRKMADKLSPRYTRGLLQSMIFNQSWCQSWLIIVTNNGKYHSIWYYCWCRSKFDFCEVNRDIIFWLIMVTKK